MLQFRMILLYFLLVLLVLSGVYYTLQDTKQAAYEGQIIPALASSRQSFESVTIQRTEKLKDLAKQLEETDIKVYLKVLNQYKPHIQEISDKARERFPRDARSSGASESVKEFVRQNAADDVQGFIGALNTDLRDLPLGIKQDKYLEILGKTLVSCMAEVDSWDVCFFKFTYIPLSQVVFPRLGMIYKDRMPQFFGLLDESGNTARVWIKNLESQIRGSEKLDIFLEALQYKKYRQENIPMLIPAVGELAQSPDTDLSTILVDGDQVYQILVHKVVGDNAQAVGYFLIGYTLDSGMAVNDVKNVMGLRPKLEDCMAAETTEGSKNAAVSPAACAREADLQDKGITYLLRNLQGTVELKGSSLPADEAEDIKRVASQSAEAWSFKSGTSTAMVADVPVDYLRDGQRMMAVLSVDTCKAMPWYFDALQALMIAGIVLFVIGGILMLWLLRAYKRPFEEIETAVHEVITGNLQARIPFEFSESLPKSLGQAIAIMRSVLLGEPLPEEQQQESLWGAQDSSPVTDDVSVAAPCHVDEPGETVPAKELEEPLAAYYARIYKDYCDILVAAGAAVDMDLPTFTESVKSTEKKLLDIYKCKGFRFKIEAREGRPNMVPFCIR